MLEYDYSFIKSDYLFMLSVIGMEVLANNKQ